ncbi:hypothetical protein D3C83_66070 [compost metagenome]
MPSFMTKNRLEKSTLPSRSPIGGMMTSLTSESTILPNAAPMMMPTAISTTLPRIANSLNSLSMMDSFEGRDLRRLRRVTAVSGTAL